MKDIRIRRELLNPLQFQSEESQYNHPWLSKQTIHSTSFDFSTNWLNRLVGLVRRVEGLSYSFTSPISNTKTRSLSMIVWIRWAIVITVLSMNCVRIVCWICISVSRPMEAVASSIRITFDFLNNALAIHRSWCWPDGFIRILTEWIQITTHCSRE